MDILEILNETTREEAKQWVNELQANNKDIHYPWIVRVNEMLTQLSCDQIKLIKIKLASRNTNQLIDKLAEILVAAEYVSDKPRFHQEYSHGPDIFLERTNKYIEVKNLNLSNNEKDLLDKTSEDKKMITLSRIGSPSLLKGEDEKKYQSLLKKAKDLINKAIEQLNGYSGFIYFIYSIDFVDLHFESKMARSERFKNDLIEYCADKKEIVLRELSDFLK